MKKSVLFLAILMLGLLPGCDDDDPTGPKETHPDFNNSEAYTVSLYSSTVSTVPEDFFHISDSTVAPTIVGAMLWSSRDTVEVEGNTGLVGDGSVVLDNTWSLSPDGQFEFLDVIFAPIFEAAIPQMLEPGSAHVLSVDSPTWGQYDFSLILPDEVELHPFDVSGLNSGDVLEISWDWPNDSTNFYIYDGDHVSFIERDTGLVNQNDPSYRFTYQPGTTRVLGLLSYRWMIDDSPQENRITTGLYQELVFEW